MAAALGSEEVEAHPAENQQERKLTVYGDNNR